MNNQDKNAQFSFGITIKSPIFAMTICGQNLEYKQIKATSGLKDGQDCFITCERQSKLYNLVLNLNDKSDIVYKFNSTVTYKEIEKLAANTQMFKVKLVEDKFYLYIPESNAFVSIVDNSISSISGEQSMFALTAEARSPITFETLFRSRCCQIVCSPGEGRGPCVGAQW